MQIIPVLDLKDGQVVHAVRGERKHYQAIAEYSQITASSDIDTVIASFLKLYDFKCIYIADLNAITQQGAHDQLFVKLAQDYPDIQFWLDQGKPWLARLSNLGKNFLSVIGTESQTQPPTIKTEDYILSLDYHQLALGHPQWFTESQYWPKTVIAMTLQRVGSQLGPDFAKLATLTRQFPEKNIIAAGGIRYVADIQQLTALGVKAALVATALHDGRISKADLAALNSQA